MRSGEHILVTGGAGTTGSARAAQLLRGGYMVTVVEKLLFGGNALPAFGPGENLHFVKADNCESGSSVCLAVGRELVYRNILDTVIHS